MAKLYTFELHGREFEVLLHDNGHAEVKRDTWFMDPFNTWSHCDALALVEGARKRGAIITTREVSE